MARVGAQRCEQVEAALTGHELIGEHDVEGLAGLEQGERLIDTCRRSRARS